MSLLANYKFTKKKHPIKGVMSAILGVISLVSLLLAVYLSFQKKGAVEVRLAIASLLATIMAVAGVILGILGRLKKDQYYLFPIMGILINAVTLLLGTYIIYAGVYGI
ncbi:MAG TPA: DUF6142 family protein [Lachnospiraceae bacterium]|mgnify:CR=1 FL=1|nr:DUF6142 family protein [Lachnospiraceae bacterium]HPF29181.1 DUF6142 family protein [Lachnospiraceae bacterium]